MPSPSEPDWGDFWRQAARFQREQLWLTRLVTVLAVGVLIYVVWFVG